MSRPHCAGPGEKLCQKISEPAVPGDPMSFYVCTAQAGHDGPDHVALRREGFEIARWPVTATEHAVHTCPCDIEHYMLGLQLPRAVVQEDEGGWISGPSQ